MYCFPRNIEKSKLWQESLGMIFKGESHRRWKICNKHFQPASFRNLISYELNKDAVPFRWVTSNELPEESEAGPSGMLSSGLHKENTGALQDLMMSDAGLGMSSVEENTEALEKSVRSESPLATQSQSTPPHQSITETPSRRRIFRNIESLYTQECSPRKKKLVGMVQSRERQLRKLKILCKRRSHDIRALSNIAESNIMNNLFKNMPSVTANFMLSQIKNFKPKNLKGRRWSLDDKILSLCILKRSPKCYNLLRKFVALPNKRTVLSLLKRVQFESGINEHLFNHLNESIPKGIERCCALLFDEIDIKENLQYDQGEDRIRGFEDFGAQQQSTELKIANKALVFMLVGLNMKWKQPVAFYFNNNGCNSTNLKKCLMEVLHAAKYFAKVDVVTTICDMGTSNVKCMKELGVTINHAYFKFENRRISCMYDPPHLLKSTVSLFRRHNVLLPVTIGDQNSIMEAKFADVRTAHEIDKRNPLFFRTMHKLKDMHLSPIMQYGMKVSIAAQVCSHTVAAYIYSLISSGTMESRAVATATFIKEVDTLFDSFNGRTLRAPEGKDLRCAVTEESPHVGYWAEAFRTVLGWTYKRVSKSGTIKPSKPPSQTGWLTSLNAIKDIWTYLKIQGCSSLNPRSLNQDPLENLFGAVRYGCGCGDNPTVQQFIGSLKCQILNGLANKAFASKNCEDDDHTLLSNLQIFLNLHEQQMDTVEQTSSAAGTVSQTELDLGDLPL